MVVRFSAALTGCLVAVAAMAVPDRREPLPEPRPNHPRLDVSSYETMRSSTYRMRERLQGEVLEEFDEALDNFVRDAGQLLRGVTSEMAYREMRVEVMKPFDGMTAAQILFELERPSWSSMRDGREQIKIRLSRVAEVLYLHGVLLVDSHGSMFPPMSRVPGRVAPDLAWLPEDLVHLLEDPSLAVSPFLPDADPWRERLEAHGAFDAALFEAALSEGYHYLSHAVMNEEEGLRYLAEYRLHAAKAVPGEVFLPTGFLGATPEMTEVLMPHHSRRTHGPLFIERPLYIGDTVIAVYPKPDHGPSFEFTPVPYGTFPNTAAFMLGLEHLRDLDIAGKDPLALLAGALKRFAQANRDTLPPYSRAPGRLFFDASHVFPGHFSNGEAVIARDHPKAAAFRARLRKAPRSDEGVVDPDAIEAVGAENYLYLLHLGRTQSEGMRMQRTYRQALETDQVDDWFFWGAHPTGEGQAMARGQREEAPDFHTFLAHPAAAARLPLLTSPGDVPQALHRIALVLEDHLYPPLRGVAPLLMARPLEPGAAVRVLYADGVIKEVPHGRFPNTAPFLAGLEELEALPGPG